MLTLSIRVNSADRKLFTNTEYLQIKVEDKVKRKGEWTLKPPS